ncbi:MAG: tRNA1(Val) (adenine(37)-N6)-methyltransferase [Nitrospirae bacterium]|nr:tRNA1(Val) (adenine(37)-N6)-methyltransferase [Nitrospirota bacterium]MBF0541751.1 tRNA1(Val) (adenine(37)-N6)-methyltransferase [Nitrospirota bacterium]
METTTDSIKGLNIIQKTDGYRFSIDAVLLSSFINQMYPKNIIDLGAGCGIIGMLLARRYPQSLVTMVEMQSDLSQLCSQNIMLNRLDEQITVINENIKNIKINPMLLNNSFDLVVSNPPFRKTTSGMLCPNIEKASARAEVDFSLEHLFSAAFSLLRGRGRLCFIYHPDRFVEVIELLNRHRLEPKRIRFVHSDIKTEAKMFLIEAAKEGRTQCKIETPLILYDAPKQYSEDVQKMLEIYHEGSSRGIFL